MPNCQDLSANFRISCTAEASKKFLSEARCRSTEDASMKSLSTKLVLSALGFTLLAGSALAQQPADQYPVDQYNVIVRGQIVGADPDAQIRTQLSREWDFRYGE
jgi:hypothetical protein